MMANERKMNRCLPINLSIYLTSNSLSLSLSLSLCLCFSHSSLSPILPLCTRGQINGSRYVYVCVSVRAYMCNTHIVYADNTI